MLPGLPVPLLQAAVVTRDTIVALTMPAERTAFDVASGTLQIIVLLVGVVALVMMAVSALALRQAIQGLHATVDRLVTDARPLLAQATRASEDARDVITLVRGEAEKLAGATGAIRQRLLDVSAAAEARIDQVNALLDVLQEEVQETALSAAATVRGLRVGAAAVGAALGGARRRRRRADEALGASLPPDDEADDDDLQIDDLEDDDREDAALDALAADEGLDPRERPYFR